MARKNATKNADADGNTIPEAVEQQALPMEESQAGATMAGTVVKKRGRPKKVESGEVATKTATKRTRAAKMVDSARTDLPAAEANLGKLEQIVRWSVADEKNLDRLYRLYQAIKD